MHLSPAVDVGLRVHTTKKPILRVGYWLFCWNFFMLLVYVKYRWLWYHKNMILLLCDFVLIAVAAVLAVRLWSSFALYKMRKDYETGADMPSVSVCIPARNEMHAMSECLERVLASDYEKLEIIVYDDSSADDTSLIVRSFAHAGVRFVAGGKLPEGWLGKNHALDILANEANGAFLLFLDVDTDVKPTTISQLVNFAVAEKLDMVTVVPQRQDTWRASVLFGVLRYFWQLVLPMRAPATSSALWLMRRSRLQEMGGLERFKNSVRPEVHIAKHLGGAYQCLISTRELGVNIEKKWRSQCETSKRLLYPLFGGKWWSSLVGVGFLVFLNLPGFILLSAFVTGWLHIHTITLIILLAYCLIYGLYLMKKWVNKWWLGMWLWPYILFQELVLLVLSVVGYWSHSITWKGRNVTAPKIAMRK